MMRVVVVSCIGLRSRVLVVRVIHLTQFRLGAAAGRQARHGGGQHAPDGDDHGEQQHEPEAKDSHELQGARTI